MELILKNKEKITVDNMNNRQNLTVKDDKGHEPDQHIIFSIFNADASIVFEELLDKIRGNNVDFSLTYGDNQELTFPGWILSDIAEEINDEQRKITLLATRIESGV